MTLYRGFATSEKSSSHFGGQSESSNNLPLSWDLFSKPKIRCTKHFDSANVLAELSVKLTNLNPEADDVNTPKVMSMLNFLNSTLDIHAAYG